MTKEEMLSHQLERYLLKIQHIERGCEPIPVSIYRAMDQYAEQESILFAEYLATWGWEMCDLNGPHAGKWVSEMNVQYGFKSINELYQAFSQSKTK